MSLFKPGALPPGMVVTGHAWDRLHAMPARPQEAERGAATEPAPVGARAADDVLAKARLEAAEILQQAAAEAEAAVAAAREQGFAAGREEGLAAAGAQLELQRKQAEWEAEKARLQAEAIVRQAEADARATRLEAEAQALVTLEKARGEAEAVMQATRQEQHQMLDDAHEALVDLAVAAAERVVQAHLAVQPAAIAAMVAAGLRRLKDSDCSVRANPQHLPLLHAQRSALERELGTGALKLMPDPSLTPGGFTIQSAHGYVDGSLEQQSAQLRSAMTAALGGS